ncbi:UNVERIFIED_ORG: hypothetical protein ABIC97_004664 [Peribacillus simplex]
MEIGKLAGNVVDVYQHSIKVVIGKAIVTGAMDNGSTLKISTIYIFSPWYFMGMLTMKSCFLIQYS